MLGDDLLYLYRKSILLGKRDPFGYVSLYYPHRRLGRKTVVRILPAHLILAEKLGRGKLTYIVIISRRSRKKDVLSYRSGTGFRVIGEQKTVVEGSYRVPPQSLHQRSVRRGYFGKPEIRNEIEEPLEGRYEKHKQGYVYRPRKKRKQAYLKHSVGYGSDVYEKNRDRRPYKQRKQSELYSRNYILNPPRTAAYPGRSKYSRGYTREKRKVHSRRVARKSHFVDEKDEKNREIRVETAPRIYQKSDNQGAYRKGRAIYSVVGRNHARKTEFKRKTYGHNRIHSRYLPLLRKQGTLARPQIYVEYYAGHRDQREKRHEIPYVRAFERPEIYEITHSPRKNEENDRHKNHRPYAPESPLSVYKGFVCQNLPPFVRVNPRITADSGLSATLDGTLRQSQKNSPIP